ncbi:MAG: hypothetical protein II644_06190 [Paludibacteraceae bacterium]|nr:hypothetical protein [Paludibacteraceae bacterium]
MKNIFRIVTICEAQKITKNDGSELIKQQLVLREQGGPYEDAYLVTWFGNEPLKVSQGMCIAASIRMRVNEGVYSTGDVPETRYYQDAVLQEYSCLLLGNMRG